MGEKGWVPTVQPHQVRRVDRLELHHARERRHGARHRRGVRVGGVVQQPQHHPEHAARGAPLHHGRGLPLYRSGLPVSAQKQLKLICPLRKPVSNFCFEFSTEPSESR